MSEETAASDGMEYAKSGDTKRVLLLGSMTSAYYAIDTDEVRARILKRFRCLVEEWLELGARAGGHF